MTGDRGGQDRFRDGRYRWAGPRGVLSHSETAAVSRGVNAKSTPVYDSDR